LIAKPDGTVLYKTTASGAPADAVAIGEEAGKELKVKCGNDALAFFGDAEVKPEPKSSVTGVETDGLGGYVKGDYAMDASGKDPGFVATK
jgi:hydroxymethylbilane synthase